MRTFVDLSFMVFIGVALTVFASIPLTMAIALGARAHVVALAGGMLAIVLFSTISFLVAVIRDRM